MNTYFIRGLECTARIGQNTWQKSISQKLVIDIEWQFVNDANRQSVSINPSDRLDSIINNISQITTTKHWQSLAELADEIKQLLQTELNPERFRITIAIPHAYADTKSVGLTIEYP